MTKISTQIMAGFQVPEFHNTSREQEKAYAIGVAPNDVTRLQLIDVMISMRMRLDHEWIAGCDAIDTILHRFRRNPSRSHNRRRC